MQTPPDNQATLNRKKQINNNIYVSHQLYIIILYIIIKIIDRDLTNHITYTYILY